MSNEKQIAFWNSEAAERWVRFQEELDRRIAPFGEAMLAAARLASGEHVLDVGCGCGATTLAAATQVGATGRVFGVDISEPMLARCRARAAEARLTNVELTVTDAATFSADAPVDVAISRFGVMFFEDPTAAFANLRRLVKPGGRLAFVAWKALADNPWAALPLATVARSLGVDATTDPDAPGPFSFGSADRVTRTLEAAGFVDIRAAAFDHSLAFGDTLDEAVDYAASMGPASRLLRELPPEAQESGRAALRTELAAHAPSFAFTASTWVVTARVPATT